MYDFPIRWLGISLGERCNLSCKYCLANSGPSGGLAALHKVEGFLEFFSPYSEPRTRILLTGGEPTLHPDLLRVVRMAKELFLLPDIVVPTNGISGESLFEELAREGVTLQVSFEGLPEIHDGERPFPSGKGSSQEVLRTISFLAENFPDSLVLRLNYSPSKFGREEEIAGFVGNLGVKRVFLAHMLAEGRGASYKVDIREQGRRMPLLARALKKKNIQVSVPSYSSEKRTVPPCGVGFHSFFLSSGGKIVGCEKLMTGRQIPERFLLGKVSDAVSLFWDRLRAFREFASEVPGNCGSCPIFDKCDLCPLQKLGGRFPQKYCDSRFQMLDQNL